MSKESLRVYLIQITLNVRNDINTSLVVKGALGLSGTLTARTKKK